MSRCNNENFTGYHQYGGRGISVCSRWYNFRLFAEDIGPRPSLRHSIDRIDVNGNYEPKNCRWATPEQQARNKRPPPGINKHGRWYRFTWQGQVYKYRSEEDAWEAKQNLYRSTAP